jgi:hypothetical protein
MTTTLSAHKVYELDHTLDHLYDGHHYDLGLIDEFENYRDIPSGFWDPAPITVGGTEVSLMRKQQPNGAWITTEMHIPESAKYWWGVESVLREIDYPYCKYGSWPIMSKRMLEVLLSVRDFPHQTIAIDIKDATQVADVERGIGLKDSGIHNHNFVIVQLLEQLDIFDWEQSVYEPSKISSSSFAVGEIKKMVLKEPETGFPSLFRVTTDATKLYVSAAARAALEAAGIGGVKFRNLAGA